MQSIKHVFFDLDHTLWDFEKNSALTYTQLFVKHNISLHINDFLEVYKPQNLKFWRLYREEKITKENLRYSRLKTVFDMLTYTISDTLIHQLADDYIKHLPEYNFLFDGTENILDYLSQSYQLHIITNGFREVQGRKLANAGIARYFKTVTDSESANVKKPHPLIFKHAIAAAGATKENAVMIGDSYEADILGAENYGIKAIHCHFDPDFTMPKIDRQIFHLNELKNYL